MSAERIASDVMTLRPAAWVNGRRSDRRPKKQWMDGRKRKDGCVLLRLEACSGPCVWINSRCCCNSAASILFFCLCCCSAEISDAPHSEPTNLIQRAFSGSILAALFADVFDRHHEHVNEQSTIHDLCAGIKVPIWTTLPCFGWNGK